MNKNECFMVVSNDIWITINYILYIIYSIVKVAENSKSECASHTILCVL